jgi:hypothetical protein
MCQPRWRATAVFRMKEPDPFDRSHVTRMPTQPSGAPSIIYYPGYAASEQVQRARRQGLPWDRARGRVIGCRRRNGPRWDGLAGETTGLPIRRPQCFSFYNVHLSQPRMRCPVRNTRLFFFGLADSWPRSADIGPQGLPERIQAPVRIAGELALCLREAEEKPIAPHAIGRDLLPVHSQCPAD